MIKVEKLNPFGRMCVSLGMIPSSYKESLTYEEQLLWFCNYLETKVIPAVNNNADALIELQNYVSNYFDNLDVQEEINNKLDEMAESGELTTLIQNYVDPIMQEYEESINETVETLSDNVTTLEGNVNTLSNDINNFEFTTTNKINDFENNIDMVENKVNSIASGSPSGVYATVSDLTSANPDHSKVYVVTEDGKWYYYDSSTSSWVAGGTYQASLEINKALGGINSAFTVISKTGATSYVASDSKYFINEYEVSANKQYHIITDIKGSNLPIVCFFNEDSFLSYSGSVNSPSATAHQNTTITTPANCTRMVVNSYATGVCKVYAEGSKINSKYATKTFITYGDSRTWYDGQTFGSNTLDEGHICNGYQYYMRNELGINTYNYGFNGNTTIQLCARVINPTYSFIYSNYNYLVLAGGINDWLQNVPLGEVAEIGSTFNTTTVAGALQTMIETIINGNPNCRIFLTSPFTGFNTNNEYTRNYTEIRKSIAKLYSLPILDLDEVSRINKLNKNSFFVDDTTQVTYQLHLTNEGYKLISNEINSFINNN